MTNSACECKRLISRAVCAPLHTTLLCYGLLTVAQAQTNYQRLKSFGFPWAADRFFPPSHLIQSSDGALYGTTSEGSSNNAGTVFRLNMDGSGYAELHKFSDAFGDGFRPGDLLQGNDGALYGTTGRGGTNDGGAMFKLNADGSGYTVLRSFSDVGGDESVPFNLLQASDGALYGTAQFDGVTSYVIKVNRDGSGYTVLAHVNDGDGAWKRPSTHLIQGSDGILYGTTVAGFTDSGTVFKLNADGSGYTLLRSFPGDDGGRNPTDLVEASDGTLYGTTFGGGATGSGTVFKLNKNGSGYAVLHSFGDSNADADGLGPIRLVEESGGTLYGVTSGGGASGGGTVFKLNTNGSGYMLLRSFGGGGDGSGPVVLLEGSDGALYGTTLGGGDMKAGTIFKLFSSTPIVAIGRIESSGAGERLNLSGGAAGQMFRIQAITNLNPPLWQTIATNQFSIDGKFQFLDTSASNYPIRFYRSATP